MLAARRAGGPLAPEVAPNNPLVGVMLPYTPASSPADAAGRTAIGDDLGESRRGTAGLPERRGAGAAGRHRGFVSDAQPRDRDAAATIRSPVSSTALRSCLRRSRGYVPRGIRVSAPIRSAGPGVRRAAEEHVLYWHARHGIPGAAHRRSRESGNVSVIRRIRCADGEVPARPPWHHRARSASGLHVDACMPRRGPSH